MKYRIKMWCPECYAEKLDGCFGGGALIKPDEYETVAEAKEAGWKAIHDTIYDFCVIDENGLDINF